MMLSGACQRHSVCSRSKELKGGLSPPSPYFLHTGGNAYIRVCSSVFLRQVLPPLDLVAFWDELKFVSFTLHVELCSHGAGCS